MGHIQNPSELLHKQNVILDERGKKDGTQLSAHLTYHGFSFDKPAVCEPAGDKQRYSTNEIKVQYTISTQPILLQFQFLLASLHGVTITLTMLFYFIISMIFTV